MGERQSDRHPGTEEFGAAARDAAGLDTIHRLPGKHSLQEDQAEAIGELVARFISDAEIK